MFKIGITMFLWCSQSLTNRFKLLRSSSSTAEPFRVRGKIRSEHVLSTHAHLINHETNFNICMFIAAFYQIKFSLNVSCATFEYCIRRRVCETQMPPIMANSKEGQGHKDKYFDTSRRIVSQEMLMCNIKAPSFYKL